MHRMLVRAVAHQGWCGVSPPNWVVGRDMKTVSGEEISTIEIKKILEKIVSNEDKRKPETDEKLVKILKDKGYKIARRTVAKYREQLNIPVARLRKEI